MVPLPKVTIIKLGFFKVFFTIRDYQEVDLEAIRAALRIERSTMYVLATGGGKTVTAGFMVKGASEKGKRIWFICHRKELVYQAQKTFQVMGMNVGLIMAGETVRPMENIQIGMVQTISRRLDNLVPPDMILFDEAHHTAAGQWRKIYESYPKAFKIGLSATPCRLDGKGLNEFFASMVLGKDTGQLIKEGRLSPYKMYAPSVIDISEIGTRGGDFKREELEKLLSQSKIIGDVITSYCKLALGKKALMFAATVAHSEKLVAEFISAGISAVHVDGKTPKALRDEITAAYSAGEYDVMSNVDLFGEGYDVPDTECIIGCRPTMSLTIYRQQNGRGLRPIYHPDMPQDTIEQRHAAIAAGSKPHAILIDHAGNCFRHGLPCDEAEWSLEPRKKRKKGESDEIGGMKQCPECWAAIKAHVKTCPECSYIWVTVSSSREHVDGELKEIDKEKLEIMKKKEMKKRKYENFKATTHEELVALGTERGYKNPASWASHVLKGKQQREERENASREEQYRVSDNTNRDSERDGAIHSGERG